LLLEPFRHHISQAGTAFRQAPLLPAVSVFRRRFAAIAASAAFFPSASAFRHAITRLQLIDFHSADFHARRLRLHNTPDLAIAAIYIAFIISIYAARLA